VLQEVILCNTAGKGDNHESDFNKKVSVLVPAGWRIIVHAYLWSKYQKCGDKALPIEQFHSNKEHPEHQISGTCLSVTFFGREGFISSMETSQYRKGVSSKADDEYPAPVTVTVRISESSLARLFCKLACKWGKNLAYQSIR